MKLMNTCRKYGAKLAVVSSVALMSLPALAEDSALVTAAKAELASAKDGVSSIGAVVIGVAAAMVVVGLIIKAVRKGG
jgi:putative uncharacterized protein (fragment)